MGDNQGAAFFQRSLPARQGVMRRLKGQEYDPPDTSTGKIRFVKGTSTDRAKPADLTYYIHNLDASTTGAATDVAENRALNLVGTIVADEVEFNGVRIHADRKTISHPEFVNVLIVTQVCY